MVRQHLVDLGRHEKTDVGRIFRKTAYGGGEAGGGACGGLYPVQPGGEGMWRVGDGRDLRATKVGTT